MLSVETINRLASDNETLRIKLEIIKRICQEDADSIAVFNLQEKIMAVINE